MRMCGMPCCAMPSAHAGRSAICASRRGVRLGRLGQAGPRLPFAAAADGDIDGQDQRREARVARAGEHVGADARDRVADRAGTSCRGPAMPGEVFGRLAGDGGQRIGDACAAAARARCASASGQIRPDMPTGAMPKGSGEVWPEKGGASGQGRTSPCRIEGMKRMRSSACAVAGFGGLGAGAAVQIFPDEMRNAVFGRGRADRRGRGSWRAGPWGHLLRTGRDCPERCRVCCQSDCVQCAARADMAFWAWPWEHSRTCLFTCA